MQREHLPTFALKLTEPLQIERGEFRVIEITHHTSKRAVGDVDGIDELNLIAAARHVERHDASKHSFENPFTKAS